MTSIVGEIETRKDESASISERKYLYLAGVNVTHSIAPPMHNYIAKSLSLPWTFINQECPTIDDVVTLFRVPIFAGGVVTMPYKKAIIPFLDEVDPLVEKLGACNNVYLTREGKLREKTEGRGKPALIIGAGEASRAAFYALFAEFECGVRYVVNRDVGEVEDLVRDAKAYSGSEVARQPSIKHVSSTELAEESQAPFYVVGSVPDFEAQTEDELKVKGILETFLRKKEKGVLLDMCFKPRNTRILKMGRTNGWKVVEGTGVIGYQIEEQWRLWAGAGEGGRKAVPQEEAWAVLKKAADESTAINF